jgi:hypothetical protein
MCQWIHLRWVRKLHLGSNNNYSSTKLTWSFSITNSTLGAIISHLLIRFQIRWIRKLRVLTHSNPLRIRIYQWWKWKLSPSYFKCSFYTTKLFVFRTQWWKRKLYPRYTASLWRRMETLGKWLLSPYNCLRSWWFKLVFFWVLLVWHGWKWKLHRGGDTSILRYRLRNERKWRLPHNAIRRSTYPCIISKCMSMPRRHWWITKWNWCIISCNW